jgi:hypothetical protein
MKKLSLFIILIISSWQTYANSTTAFMPKPIHIRIDILLASHASGCDEGFGICSISFGGRPFEGGRNAAADCYIENETFVLEIFKNSIAEQLENDLSGNSYFTMNDPYDLPDELLNKMEMKKSYTIPAGKYLIINSGESYIINFNLN